MSALVIVIGIYLLVLVIEVMSMPTATAEWEIATYYPFTGGGLLTLAATVIWRTLAARALVWEAAIQYAISGGLLAWAMLWHAFESQALVLAQIHLAVTGLFCLWNLYSIYHYKYRLQ